MQREIGIIIRVKDAAKAKEEIKGIVDNKLLGNVKAATDNFKKMGDEVKTSGDKAKKAKDEFGSFFSNLTKGAGALYAIRRGMNFAFGSFEMGAGLERAAVQFESSIGNINTMLPALRNATRGTVEDMKLLQTANRSVMEGLDPRNLTKMYQMATVASRKLGLESEQAIQTISNAIVRQDESALATLGTILKTNVGLKVQNALIAKNGGVMAGAAAIAIRQSVIMSELNKRFGGFNKLQEDSVEIIQQFRAALTNLRMSIGPVIGQFLAPMLKLASALANSLAGALKVLSDSPSFQTAARNIGIVLSVFTGAKVVSGILSVTKSLGLFAIGLKSLAILGGGLALFKIMGLETNDLSKGFERLATGASVFFQLISSYNSKTGMSEILKKDKDALGSFYDVVFTAAKMFKVLEAAGKGALQGIKSVIDFITPVLGSFGSALSSVLDSIINNKPLLQSSLDQIQGIFNVLTAAGAGTALVFIIGKFVAFGAALKGTALALATFLGIAKGMGALAAIATVIKGLAAAFGALTLAMASNPIGLALLAGGALAGAAYLASDNSPSSSASTVQAQAAPDMREQNVQAGARSDFDQQMLKYMSALPKLVDIQERQDVREEQRDVQSRVMPSGGNIYRR